MKLLGPASLSEVLASAGEDNPDVIRSIAAWARASLSRDELAAVTVQLHVLAKYARVDEALALFKRTGAGLRDPDTFRGLVASRKAGRPIPPPVLAPASRLGVPGSIGTCSGRHRLLSAMEHLTESSDSEVEVFLPAAVFAS